MHSLFFQFFRCLPRELCLLVCSVVVPVKRRSYYSDYFQLLKSEDPKVIERRLRLWRQMNAMLGYTIVLLGAQFILDHADDKLMMDVALWRIALCDLIHQNLMKNPETKLVFALWPTLALYYNYSVYRKINYRLINIFDQVIYCRPGWRRFFPARHFMGVSIERLVRIVPLAIVNCFCSVILATDLSLIFAIAKKLHSYFAENQFENWNLFGSIDAQLIASVAGAANCFPIIGSMLMYEHFCVLRGGMALAILVALYVRIVQNQLPLLRLLRTKRWSERAILRFERYNVGSIELLGLINRVLAKEYLAFLTFNAPSNAYFVLVVTLNRFERSASADLVIGLIVWHQFLAIFAIHFFLTQLSNRFHRSGKMLLVAFGRNQRAALPYQRTGARFRPLATQFALRVSQIIARLHVKRRYGMMYGRIALVSMPLFAKFLLFYGEFWMFLYVQIKYHQQ